MFSQFNQDVKSFRRRFAKNIKKHSLMMQLRGLKRSILTRRFLVRAAIFSTVIGLMIGGYILRSENDENVEDDNDDNPWPGLVYRSSDDDSKPEVKVTNTKTNDISNTVPKSPGGKVGRIVNLAVVACEGIQEALTMIKSAIIFSKHVERVNIIAVTDRKSQFRFYHEIDQLRKTAQVIGFDVEYEVYAAWFPMKNHKLWTSVRHPCSFQKLFFPTMFPHLDNVIYIDPDVYFVSDLAHLWGFFKMMDSQQLAAMVAEHELPGDGWYNLHSKTPYYGPRGLNAGIILMNLTRMRDVGIENIAASILETYYNQLSMIPDQDILNVLFHFYPEYLLEMDCMYNFRGQHCLCDYPGGGCACKSVKPHGASIIHGNRQRFRYYVNSSLEFLRDFYGDFHQYNLASNKPETLYEKLLLSYKRVEKKPCGMKGENLLSNFKHYLVEIMLNKRFFGA